MKFLIIYILSICINSAFAEYRAYQYIVNNEVKVQDSPNGHFVVSTLDPVSFLAYNGGSVLINVDLLRTWICPGHTGYNNSICDSPYGKVPAGVFK